MKEGIRRRISDVLDLPPDIILNLHVVITGKIAVFVENHKELLNIILNWLK